MENSETIASKKNWYDNKLFTHVLLILFFPAGLYSLWKTSTIAKWWKITATVLILLVVMSTYLHFTQHQHHH